jgi:hypothetical protein
VTQGGHAACHIWCTCVLRSHTEAPSLWPSPSRPCSGLSFEVADAVIVSSDRHAFTVGLNVTVLSGSLGVGMKPMVPLDALLGGGRADKAEAGGWLGWMRCWGVDGPTRPRLVGGREGGRLGE